MTDAKDRKDPIQDERTPAPGKSLSLDCSRLERGLLAAFDEDVGQGVGLYRSVVQRVAESGAIASRVSLSDFGGEPAPLARPRGNDEETPSQIGRFRIEGEIARGGVGAVYKARDEDLGRDVAVKVLLQDYRANFEMTRRFMEEAQIGGQLQHPGIVPVHELGLYSGTRPYFAMKLVQGQTLARLLEQRRSTADDRSRFLKIFEQICQPVGYAHARRVIHRDLKPSNVMVGAFGEVQVMDWGLAKVLVQGGIADDRRGSIEASNASVVETLRSSGPGSGSIAGSVLGTPAYMAPEQARGDVGDLDERTDVFGLGAILCEVLTGRPPYVGASISEIHRKAKEGAIEDARARLDECSADSRVIDLAKRCLAFDPHERPRDASEVAQEISAFLESLEEQARQSEIRAARARTRAAALVVSTLAVLAVTVSVGWVVLQRRNVSLLATVRARESISKVSQLVARAESARAGDAERWVAALEAARTAQAVMTQDADPAAREELAALTSTIESGRRRQALLGALQRIQNQEQVHLAINLDYAAAFREFLGDDLFELPPERAAELLRQANLADDVAFALDDWVVVRKAVGADSKPIMNVALLLSTTVWRVRLYALLQRGTVEVVHDLEASEELIHVPAAILSVLAGWLESQGDYVGAERLLRRAIDMEPASLRANKRLARLLCSEAVGRCEEGLQYFHIVYAADLEEPYHGLEIALTHARHQQYDTALRWFSRVFARNGANMRGSRVDCLQGLLACLDQTQASLSQDGLDGLIQQLLRIWHESLAGGSQRRLNRWQFWQPLALALVRRYGEHALEEGRRLLEGTLPADSDPYYLAARSRLEFAAGKKVEAIRTLEAALQNPGASKGWAGLLSQYRTAILPTLASCASVDAALDLPQPIVSEGAVWAYHVGSRAEPTGLAWTRDDFDDSGWRTGPSGFGYGNDDDATVLLDMQYQYACVFVRKRFEVPSGAPLEAVTLRITADDAFVAWVNGQRVGGAHVELTGDDDYEPSTVTASPEPPRPVDIDLTDTVHPGTNLIAIVGLNGQIHGSNFSLIPEISARRRETPEEARQRIDALRQTLSRRSAGVLSAYLEGRLLAAQGEHAKAAGRFLEAIANDRTEPLPFLRLWESLIPSGDPEAAQRTMKEVIEKGAPASIVLRFLDISPRVHEAIVHGPEVLLEVEFPKILEGRVKHTGSRWQICDEGGDFERRKALDFVSSESLTSLRLPPGLLLPGHVYRWRVLLWLSTQSILESQEGRFLIPEHPLELVRADLTALYTSDVITSTEDAAEDPFDGWQFALVEDGLRIGVGEPAVGLPRDRAVGVHQLAPYAGRNAIQILPGKAGEPMRVAMPERRYTMIRVLGASGYGDVSVPATLGYVDGTTSSHELYFDDWCEKFEFDEGDFVGRGLRGDAYLAIDGMQRSNWGQYGLDAKRQAGLLEQTIVPSSRSPLRAIVLEAQRAVGTGSLSRCNIFAITGVVVGED